MGLFSAKTKDAAKASTQKDVRFAVGRVGYAIGDIHGRADLLGRMLERIEGDFRAVDGAAPIIIFLGDYVDRGDQSREVLELLSQDSGTGFERRFLKGNHEAAMLQFLEDPIGGRAWLNHGGLETLASYDVYPLPSQGASGDELLRAGERLRAQMPKTHLQFLDNLERYIVFGDYCFVHAGIDPARKLEAQTDSDLFWIRRRFIEDVRPLAITVVHGHTPEDGPYRDQRRIGLDTGAYFSGVLSGARFEGEKVSFIQVR